MKSILAKEFSRIDLGYRGENLSRQVVFDLTEWQSTYGNGTAMLIAQLPNAQAPYPCSVLREGDLLLWPLSAADTSVAGQGKCELSYYVGEQLVKSAVFSTYIAESLAPIGESPEPKDSWIEDILAAGADALSAKEAIENMSVSAEALPNGDTANVTKTEDNGNVHLHFSLPRGERGEKGERGEQGEKGEKGEKGEIGARGEKGDPPVRGVDYFTDSDVAYFDERLLAQFGDALDSITDIQSGFIESEAALDSIIATQESLMEGEAI